jgi:acetyl esterase/lipase
LSARRLGLCAWPLLLLVAVGAVVVASPRAGFHVERDLNYDRGSPPAPPSTLTMNRLDIYRPLGKVQNRRPVIVWVHGGGWRRGDKRTGVGRKAELFTGAGYVFASINYRLSPAAFDPRDPDPERVMFPAHPDDVGEALGWLDRHVRRYGGDRRRFVLIGHSAGAHLASLVATSPRYGRAHGVEPSQIAGFVALDTPSFDITAGADPETSQRPREGREMFWNAFGTPNEPGARKRWRRASPVRFADPGDPPALLVTQIADEQRQDDHRAMARALGRNPRRAVLSLPLDHREISNHLGADNDASGLTETVRAFVRRAVRRPR